MKPFIVPFALVLFLTGCSEEEIKPDPFVGSWSFDSQEIQVAFDVVKEGAVLNYYNTLVSHPAIPEAERTNNRLVTFDKFANGNGYGRIEITSRGYVYYKVSLIYNRFLEDGNMAVYDVQVDIAGQEFFVLTDRIFVKL